MSFTYDQAGNTTSRTVDGQLQELTWDAEGRITQVEDGGDSIRMVYDADGNRLIRDDGDTVTAYLPHTELTWDRATNTVDGTRYFTHTGQVVAVCTGQDPADWTWMGVDHHGSTTTHSVNAFTAVEQVRRMDPYGNPRGTAPPNLARPTRLRRRHPRPHRPDPHRRPLLRPRRRPVPVHRPDPGHRR